MRGTLEEHFRLAMQGSRIIDPALTDGHSSLTKREREVLAVALSGASIANIARQLCLSEGTVRNHLSLAIQKLRARNRVKAARRA